MREGDNGALARAEKKNEKYESIIKEKDEFESLLQPLIVMLEIPMNLAGVFLALYIENNNLYRYFRYVSSDSEDIRISSIKLYNKGFAEPVTGEAYGFVSDYTACDDHIFSNAFDKNIRSNFNAPRGSWVALDAGEPVKIESLRIMARNSQNIVEPGDTYELYYFDKGWKSLGCRVADDYHLTYHNVPKEALLLLRNHTKGRQERIFAYTNDEQGWW